jgi:hypothetical protein
LPVIWSPSDKQFTGVQLGEAIAGIQQPNSFRLRLAPSGPNRDTIQFTDTEAIIVLDKNDLGASWVRFQSTPKTSAEYHELEWVVEQMWDLCIDEPEKAWNAIQEIIALDRSDNILAMVGAGPFEDLMVHHGTSVRAQAIRRAVDKAL